MGLTPDTTSDTAEVIVGDHYAYKGTTVEVTDLEDGGETALVKVVSSTGAEVVGAALRVHIERFTEVWEKQ